LPTHSTASIRSFIGDGSWMLLRRAAPEVEEAVIDTLNQTFKSVYQENWNHGTEIFEGILELLDDAKKSGIINTILSNKPHPFTTEIAATLFPEGTFDFVLGQKDNFPSKPSPESTIATLEQLNLTAEEVLFIGDSTIDLQTATNAQVDGAAVTWGYHDIQMLQQENPMHTAHSIEELRSIIFS